MKSRRVPQIFHDTTNRIEIFRYMILVSNHRNRHSLLQIEKTKAHSKKEVPSNTDESTNAFLVRFLRNWNVMIVLWRVYAILGYDLPVSWNLFYSLQTTTELFVKARLRSHPFQSFSSTLVLISSFGGHFKRIALCFLCHNLPEVVVWKPKSVDMFFLFLALSWRQMKKFKTIYL